MRRFVSLTALLALVAFGAAFGLWHQAHAGRQVAAARPDETTRAATRHDDVVVAAHEGSFVLHNLRLAPAGRSTKLTCEVINYTNKDWGKVTFAVAAFDADGARLRGTEEETIFSFYDLAPGANASAGHGHGVWLEGVPPDRVARIEVVLIDEQRRRALTRASNLHADIEE